METQTGQSMEQAVAESKKALAIEIVDGCISIYGVVNGEKFKLSQVDPFEAIDFVAKLTDNKVDDTIVSFVDALKGTVDFKKVIEL